MAIFHHRIQDHLLQHGHELLGRTAPPSRVFCKSQSKVLITDLYFDDAVERIVIKLIQQHAILQDPRRLFYANQRLRRSSQTLSRGLSRVIAFETNNEPYVVIEYVPGPTLLQLLRHDLRVPRRDDTQARNSLRQAATALASIHRVRPHDIGLPPETRRNDSYIDALAQSWRDPILRSAMPRDLRTPDAVLSRLDPSFTRRVTDRILLVDCQPKNILVPHPGEARFIDQDYSTGNPALCLAQFLVSLDRLALTYPMLGQWERLWSWQSTFIDAYMQSAESWIAQDLLFFYPWAVAHTVHQHAAQRPHLRPYLAWVYARRLSHFLTRLRHTAPSASPALLLAA